MEVLNIYEETCRYENVKMDHMKNGNLWVKIKFQVAEIEKIQIFQYFIILNIVFKFLKNGGFKQPHSDKLHEPD